jgi:hypothetical protein
MSIRTRSASIVFAAVVAAVPALSRATNYTFTSQSGSWATPGDWLNGLVPTNDPSANVIIKGASAAALTSLIDASQPVWAINGLTLDHAGSQTATDVLTIDPASTLEFVGAGAFINQAFEAATTINGPINLATDLNVISTGPAAITLTGPISGAGGIIFGNSEAPLTLAGNNTFTGGLTIAATGNRVSSITIASPSALGTGNLTITHYNGPAIQSANIGIGAATGTSTTITNNIVVNSVGSDPTLNMISFFGNNTPANYTNILQHVVVNGAAELGFSQLGHLGSAPTWDVQSLTLDGNLIVNGGNVTIDSLSESQPSSVTTSLGFPTTLTLTGVNHYSGGTFIDLTDTGYANASGALGTGNVTVAGTLHLNAIDSAQASVSGNGTVYYSANGAAGGHLVAISTLILDNSVTSFSNGAATDSFNIGNGSVSGNTATLALLDRGIGSGTAANFLASAGAQIENTDGGLPTVQNVGMNADLIPVVHTTAPLTVAVGTGTPWAGLAGGTTQAFIGTLIGNSDFVLAGGLLGNGTAASFGIAAPSPGGSPVIVTVQAATISSPLSDYAGVSRFSITGTLRILGANGLGGVNGTTPVSADVTGTVITGDPAALNGNVTLHAGSSLEIDSAGLSGTGIISRVGGAITLMLGNANALTGSQINGSFLQAGDVVDLAANNVVGLKSLNGGLNFVVGGNRQVQQGEGININGGSLFFSNPEQSLVAGTAAQGDSTIHIGASGATIAGYGNYSESFNTSSGDSGIAVPIMAAGTVNFGYAANAPSDTSGAIVLANTSNQFGLVNVNNMTLVAASPATLTGASITLNGAQLVLLSNLTNSPLPPTAYNNNVTVVQNSTISDNILGISSIFPPPGGNHPIALSTVNLRSATLAVNSLSITFNTLNLVGNGTIQGSYINQNTLLTISSISEDNSSRSLAFVRTGVTLQTSLTATSPISLANSTLEFDGSSTPSNAPLTIGDRSVLGGVGTISARCVFLDHDQCA